MSIRFLIAYINKPVEREKKPSDRYFVDLRKKIALMFDDAFVLRISSKLTFIIAIRLNHLVFVPMFKLIQRHISDNGHNTKNPVSVWNVTKDSFAHHIFPYSLSTQTEQIKTWFSQVRSSALFSTSFCVSLKLVESKRNSCMEYVCVCAFSSTEYCAFVHFRSIIYAW